MNVRPLVGMLEGFMARRPEVRLAYLFGSQARGKPNALSDVDVAVLLTEDLSAPEQGQARLRLLSDLMVALERDDVDLIVLNRASPLLRQRVLRDGRLLFAADERVRVRFAEDTYRRYLDHRHMYEVLGEAMFERLREGRFGRGQVGASNALRKARAMHREDQDGA